MEFAGPLKIVDSSVRPRETARQEANGTRVIEFPGMPGAPPPPHSPSNGNPERAGIEAELARILASPQFRTSRRRCELLQWSVGRFLAGEKEPVKEYHIAQEVFGKSESWDPRFDSSVRVEFNRMRQKLREYYQSDGAHDSIVIEFPFRGYLPAFRSNEPATPENQEPPPTTRRRKLRLAAIAAIAISLVVPLGFAVFRSVHPRPPITTIAVLPFLDLTPGGGHEYWSDGFTEELTNSLAMIKALRVVARTSAFQFKGKNIDVREIGRELGAGAVVEGSISGQGDRIRVIVQLNRTGDGTHIWQAQYDRETKNILRIEDEIAQSIAAALRIRLTGRPAAFQPGEQAFDEYMKGIDDERKSDPASLRAAEGHYRNAIRLAPGYARAYARLGSIHLARSSFAGRSQTAELEQASQNLQTALSLDPQLALAAAGLALVDYLLNWDWDGAEAGFRRALELGPSSATHQTYAAALMTRGRFAEAERHYREAIELDPLNCVLHDNLAKLYYNESRRAAARQELQTCLERQPDWFLGRMHLGYFDVFDNRPADALSEFERAVRLAPGTPTVDAGIAIAYAESRRRSESLALLRQMESQADARGYSLYSLALVSAYLGDRDRLFHWLEQSVKFHEQQALSMRIDPAFAPYQRDPRMLRLQRRVGLI
jgi:adenylate cyclase